VVDQSKTMMIHVEGATQDEALINARKIASEKKYRDVSLQNVINITYTAMLYNPIRQEKKSKEE
jgi:hypothetical protein